MNWCQNCGTEINSNLIYCDNCKELKDTKTNERIAKWAFVIFIIGYILISIFTFQLADLGNKLGGASGFTLKEIIRLSTMNFLLSSIPFFVSLCTAKKAKLNKLFTLELIIAIAFLICSFV